jgi:nucleoside-diphosphate-sugar epimerase
MEILITGANGFVGSELTSLLANAGHQLRLATRTGNSIESDSVTVPTFATGDIQTFDDWDAHLKGVDVVVHLAARVHQMDDQASDARQAYWHSNVDATVRLAESAIRCGVKRFIFLSTIKVNGENTTNSEPFSADNIAAPLGDYAQSKWQAEQELEKLSASSDMGVVIIRPPLVYGPGVKANFMRLVNLARSGLPLPFLGIDNRRDMVSVYNLCDLIAICTEHDNAAGKTFLVSDGAAYSTAGIILAVRLVLGLPKRLFYLPPGSLRWPLKLLGKADLSDRLFGSLEVDITDTIETLDWSPKYTLEHTLREMLN